MSVLRCLGLVGIFVGCASEHCGRYSGSDLASGNPRAASAESDELYTLTLLTATIEVPDYSFLVEATICSEGISSGSTRFQQGSHDLRASFGYVRRCDT
jgi:hypothetical protein